MILCGYVPCGDDPMLSHAAMISSSDEEEGYKYRSPPAKVVKKLLPMGGPLPGGVKS